MTSSLHIVFSSPWPKSLTPTPYSQKKDSAWNILTKLSGSTFLHDILASMINPATSKEKVKKFNGLRVQLFKDDALEAQEVSIRAPDGSLINGAFFKGTSKKTILFAVGAGGAYESIADKGDAAHDFIEFFRNKLGADVNILVINTNGIGKSTGSPSLRGSALAYYAAWNYLESLGLEVLPWGHSLGFRTLVQAAAWKQEENPTKKISIVADRSFNNFSQLACAAKGGGIKGMGTQVLIGYSGWGGDGQRYLSTLKGEKIILYSPEDQTIRYPASLHKHIRECAPLSSTTAIKLSGGDKPHTRIYNEEETRALKSSLGPLLDIPSDGQPTIAETMTFEPKKPWSTATKLLATVVLTIIAKQAWNWVYPSHA